MLVRAFPSLQRASIVSKQAHCANQHIDRDALWQCARDHVKSPHGEAAAIGTVGD